MNENALRRQFRSECMLLDMNAEYPGHIEDVRWILLTDLSPAQLEKYSGILSEYVPYQIYPINMKEPIAALRRNEQKHRRRAERNTVSLDDETQAVRLQEAVSEDPFENGPIHADYRAYQRDVRKALKMLSVVQQRRLLMWSLLRMSAQDIAKKEGCKKQSIMQSIHQAQKRFTTFYPHTYKKWSLLLQTQSEKHAAQKRADGNK